jgi:hypothetical protein
MMQRSTVVRAAAAAAAATGLVLISAAAPAEAFPTSCSTGGAGTSRAIAVCNSGTGQWRVTARCNLTTGPDYNITGPWVSTPGEKSVARCSFGGAFAFNIQMQLFGPIDG